MAKIRTMTEGHPLKLIFAFSLPLMFGNVFQQFYTVVDTMVVGQALGVGALAALGAADWLNWMVLGMIQGISQGFAILMAYEFGAGDYRKLRQVIANSAILACLGSVVMLALMQAAARPVLLLLNTPDEIIGRSLLYLRIMFWGIPIVMAYNVLASILRAMGDGKTPLHAMVVASAVNIGLDLLFVLVFHWGIGGAAAATLIAQACSSLYCLRSLLKVSILSFEKKDFHLEPYLCRKLMTLGIPMAFQNGIIAVGGMIVQSVVNGFGVLFIAGFTATNKLYGLLEIAATSYGYAMTTYVGQNLGAGKIDRIRKGVRSSMLLSLLTSLIISIAMFLFGKNILSLFISGEPQQTQEVLAIAFKYLSIMAAMLWVLYFLYVYRSALQGLGDTLMPMVSGMAEFVMRISAALILPHFIGQDGIFFAEIAAWSGATVILCISYYVRMHKYH